MDTSYDNLRSPEFDEWSDFENEQIQTFRFLHKQLRQHLGISDEKAAKIPSGVSAGMAEECTRASRFNLLSTADLAKFEKTALIKPVQTLYAKLCEIYDMRRNYSMDSIVGFELHNHPSKLMVEDFEKSSKKVDLQCVHSTGFGRFGKRLLFFLEYAPAYERPVASIRNALSKLASNSMSELDPIERKVKQSLHYLYHRMVDERVAYSCISTGEAYLFLKVDEDPANHLLFHLCVPAEDAVSDTLSLPSIITPISRMLCLTLIATKTPLRPLEWRCLARSLVTDDTNLPEDYEPSRPATKADFVYGKSPTPAFCSMICLLNLKRGFGLDERCPNYRQHLKHSTDNKHPAGIDGVVEQLSKTMTFEDFGPIVGSECGTTGTPFWIRCPTYGYVFIGKGASTWSWPEVLDERKFYNHLNDVQGTLVPVFVGTMYLNPGQRYFLHGVGEISRFLLLAWGGRELTREEWYGSKRKKVKYATQIMEAYGIEHNSLKCSNALWNDELKKVLLIDFHRSEMR
ncbi:hypothetical protein K470DRAFT_255125 [Piedraia hortae CBS 480.64]|uniref:Protein kinase domain-containing protein n=1 Tax=Piedraia hortae CBS 480.64 TaxID=1314780 RepID=A0A6A7C7P3_9PEZI|nr:hypothetical protein K470DRAFT_255125 [Piedraia hortae CBS 480.64]